MEVEMKSANHFLWWTKIAFTPFILYPATGCNTIHTFWLIFRVFYHKKVQSDLHLPHRRRTSIAQSHKIWKKFPCCGKHIKESGVPSIFVKCEIFCPEVVTQEIWNSINIRSPLASSVFNRNCGYILIRRAVCLYIRTAYTVYSRQQQKENLPKKK